jgi:SAM-dependent methyltransferase
VSPSPRGKKYDRAYFDRWYRDPRSRVVTPTVIARKSDMVVGVAEYFLGRTVRSVLDVGCGEGDWYRALKRKRPRIRYQGIDPSPYVVERFGARRNIALGGFGDIGSHADGRQFDVIICSDVLQYVDPPELARGVARVAEHLDGVAFLEAHTTADDLEGDMRGWHRRTPGYYRRLFTEAGLIPCGPHCYASETLRDNISALERLTK